MQKIIHLCTEYLYPQDIQNLVEASPKLQPILSLELEIIQSISNGTIYAKPRLLKIVYSRLPLFYYLIPRGFEHHRSYLEKLRPLLGSYVLKFSSIPGIVHAHIQLGFSSNLEPLIDLYLQDFGMDPSANNNNAVILATLAGELSVVSKLLKDPRTDPTDQDNIAIIIASQVGLHDAHNLIFYPRLQLYAPTRKVTKRSYSTNVEIFKLLCSDPRIDLTFQNNSLLINAVQNESIDVVKILLADKRVNPSDQDNLALERALAANNYAMVKLLLEDPRVDLFARDCLGLVKSMLNEMDDDIRTLLKSHNILLL